MVQVLNQPCPLLEPQIPSQEHKRSGLGLQSPLPFRGRVAAEVREVEAVWREGSGEVAEEPSVSTDLLSLRAFGDSERGFQKAVR